MRILGWSIDGFGMFRDFEVRDLPEGVTVFHGPNEAGKSTLLAFLRGVLFGFPDRRRRVNRYEPMRGGRHGGRVFLLGEEGEVVVERRADVRQPPRVLLPDGEGAEPDLHALFGGADETLFNNVFAFSLAELHSMESLTREGVSDRIFSAGIAGAGRDARAAMKTLDERAADLLKQGRGKGRLNELGAELASLDARLKEARRAAKGYADLAEAERSSGQAVEEMSRRAETLRRERDRCGTLLKLWPLRSEVAEARQELAGLEDTAGFPQDPEIRLESALKEARQAERRLQERLKEKELAEKNLEQLAPDEAAGRIAAEIESLCAELSLHRERLRNLPRAREGLRRANEALAEKLADLGPDWTLERLEAFDRSIPRSEEAREWEARLAAAAAQAQAARRRHEDAEASVGELGQRVRRLAAGRPKTPPPERETLEAQESAARRLRANWAQCRDAERDLRSIEESARVRERIVRELETAPEPMRLRSASWACGIGAALALLAALIGFFTAAPGAGVVLLALGAVLGVATWFLVRADRRQARLQEQAAARLEAARREHDDAVAERDRCAERMATLKANVARDAGRLGLPPEPDAHQIEEASSKIARALLDRAEWDRVGAEMQVVEAELKQARAESVAAEEAVQNEAAALDTVHQEWAAWRTEAGIEADLDPRGALDFFDAVRVARDAAREVRRAGGEAESLERETGDWEARAKALMSKAGGQEEASKSGDELVAAVLEWRRRCQEDAETRRLRKEQIKALDDIQASIETAEAELRQCVQDRDRLFEAARASDEEDFRRRAGVHKRRGELEALVKENERQIRHILGQGREAEALAQELESGHSREWERRLEEAQAELETIESRRDEALRAHRDAETERKRLAESADVPALENERGQLLEEMAEAAQEWQAVSAARGLIGETLREFERTRQPEVLAQASRWFGQVTSGEYERLTQGEAEGELLVHHRSGAPKRVEELSRGTAEQLYVCIRLGLAAEFGRRSRPKPLALPFVMDDVLVNFDPARARAMAEALSSYAEGRQVLFFTCHPSTRDLLLESGAAHAVEMETGQAEGEGGDAS